MLDKFFKDKDGKIVLIQFPNPPLIAWAVCTVIARFTGSDKFAWLATAFLFAWAFMELYLGTTYFRRLLGLSFLIFIIYGQFR